ncbi:Bet v1-like protein [Dioscorea alata]|uniref:Bet v1-like protein n=1 Tax=Dioscorea alata TaxID=55571 RepID=A0ACB7VNP0_DIOAL|nr:Bet v1-like protein [Dioscorea alata]
MAQRIEAQIQVEVGVEILWRTFAEEFRVTWPKVVPDIVVNVEVVEGDGGLGSLLFLQFKPGGPTVPYQKTKIVELDSTKHKLGLEVVEGGHLSNGFSKYVTFFKLTSNGERETQVDVAVECEPVAEEADLQEKTTKFPLLFFRCLENYLQTADA